MVQVSPEHLVAAVCRRWHPQQHSAVTEYKVLQHIDHYRDGVAPHYGYQAELHEARLPPDALEVFARHDERCEGEDELRETRMEAVRYSVSLEDIDSL